MNNQEKFEYIRNLLKHFKPTQDNYILDNNGVVGVNIPHETLEIRDIIFKIIKYELSENAYDYNTIKLEYDGINNSFEYGEPYIPEITDEEVFLVERLVFQEKA